MAWASSAIENITGGRFRKEKKRDQISEEVNREQFQQELKALCAQASGCVRMDPYNSEGKRVKLNEPMTYRCIRSIGEGKFLFASSSRLVTERADNFIQYDRSIIVECDSSGNPTIVKFSDKDQFLRAVNIAKKGGDAALRILQERVQEYSSHFPAAR